MFVLIISVEENKLENKIFENYDNKIKIVVSFLMHKRSKTVLTLSYNK